LSPEKVLDTTIEDIAVRLSGGEQVSETCVRSQTLADAAFSLVQMMHERTSPERIIEVASSHIQEQEQLSVEQMPISSLATVEKILKPTTRALEENSVVSSENTSDSHGPRSDELAMTLSTTDLKKVELYTSVNEGKPVQRARLVVRLNNVQLIHVYYVSEGMEFCLPCLRWSKIYKKIKIV